MKYLLSVLVMLVLSIPVAAQEFTQVRPTIIVSPTGQIIAPIRPIISPTAPIVSSTASIVSPFVIVRPAAPPPLVLPPVRLPPLLLFQTKRGMIRGPRREASKSAKSKWTRTAVAIG